MERHRTGRAVSRPAVRADGGRAALHELYGDARPSTLARLWQTRHFIAARAVADLRARHARHRLGLVWVVLNPLLSAAVYYLLFGVLLDAGRGITDYVTFLVTGVVVFQLTARTLQAATWTINGNAKVVQTLRLPTAALPASMGLAELYVHLPGLIVVGVVAVLDGIRPDPAWLLLVPAVLVQLVFTFGLALIVARLSFQVPDLSNLVPHLLRVWLYASGVLFGVELVAQRVPSLVGLFTANPMWLFLRLHRDAVLLTSADATTWALAGGWAVVSLVIGLLVFGGREGAYRRA